MGTLGAKLKILRQKAKCWKKSLQPDRSHLNNSKKALDLMDWIEEPRSLSHIETIFRNIVKRKISSLIHLVAVAARQIGKVNWCVLGDEDTGFYHSRASARLRSNKIKTVESGGTRYFIHKEKERIFTNFYRNILGKNLPSQNLIDLEEVYPNSVDLTPLTSPFSELEIHKAIKEIPPDKSPGQTVLGQLSSKIFRAL
jgi:hypothetical protein